MRVQLTFYFSESDVTEALNQFCDLEFISIYWLKRRNIDIKILICKYCRVYTGPLL